MLVVPRSQNPSIKWSRRFRLLTAGVFLACASLAATREPRPTFYKDVLPILQTHCQDCHRAGEAAPMPLMTYSQTRPWAKAIKAAVLTRKMPPWFADPRFGKFSNDPSLNPAEITTLTAWVDKGSPAGAPADAPQPRQFVEGWRIPQPDAIFELPEPVTIPAAGVIDYKFYLVPTNFTEDRWVEAIEVRPTNRSIVHHAVIYSQGQDGWEIGNYLGGYAPGSLPQIWNPGQARLIKAGSSLLFQMHYTSNGKPSTDRTQVGLVFAKHPPRQQVIAMTSTNAGFVIPPGAADYPVDSVRVIPQDCWLVGLRAHMHLRGKSFEFRAVYPDGRSEILLRVPRYDFNWQPYYYLETPLKLPRLTRIECTAHYDNSVNNAFNPDPSKAVRWGDQTWDEMMVGWFDVAVPLHPELTGLMLGRRLH